MIEACFPLSWPVALTLLADFFAHSNYTELALIEMGERDVFPHVGQSCRIRLEGARGDVYPIVTGTFGGVDFLHSVVGEGKQPGVHASTYRFADGYSSVRQDDPERD